MSVKSITTADVTNSIIKKENQFILDVRTERNFVDWKIEGENFNYLNVPYMDLLEGVESILDQLPKDKEILVVCAKERTSKIIAEHINKAGLSAVYLQGGMQSWSEHQHKIKVYEDQSITVFQFVRMGKGCLSYMVISGDEALVIDASRFISDYEEAASEFGAKITHIVDSHLHADHITGGPMLAEKTGAKYYIMASEGAVIDFEPLEEYEKIEFNDVEVEVIAVKTPGHTPGSVSFFVNDALLFSGDTIFVSGLGRPDLGNKVREWAEDLYNTVYSKVSEIADDVIVYPAHYGNFDDETNSNGYIGDNLGNIRKRNEKMFKATKDEFLDNVEKSASSVKPPNFEEIVAINRGELRVDVETMQELEVGPNRCAVHHTD